MNLSIHHFLQYKKIAGLLWKYGRSDVIKDMALGGEAEADKLAARPSDEASKTELADDLEAMEPTYVKLGQVLASRPDILSPTYQRAVVPARWRNAFIVSEACHFLLSSRNGWGLLASVGDFYPGSKR